MRLLAVSDMEDEALVAQLASRSMPPVDVVISCGDLRPGYLDYVATMANAPLAYVRGNHDTDDRGYGVMGGTALDLRVVRMGGLRIAGLDGSVAYREGIVGFSEGEMWRRAIALAIRAKLVGGVDILVTHAPPRGYGDLEDLPHRGFVCFNWLLEFLKPKLMLCGHVHLNYGLIARERIHQTGVKIVNAYSSVVLDV